jgi:chloramphenicol 3-O-phosphotransferase
MSGAVFLLTGWQASGKSTLAPLLAARFPLSAHVEGDVMWKMVMSGREDMTRQPTDEAVRQLKLRYRHGAMVADSYAAAGFTAVHTDIIMGDSLATYPSMIEMRPLYVVVLRPRPAVLAARDKMRRIAPESADDDAAFYDAELEASPRIGLWLDSSDRTPDETVDEILARLDEALISS